MTRALRSTTLAMGLLLVGCTENNPVATFELGTGRDGSRRDGLPASDGSPPVSDGAPPSDGAPAGERRLDSVGPPKPDGYSCKPNAFLSCKTASQLLQCNLAGTATVIVDCSPYLCDPVNKRCTQCDPKSAPACQGNDLVFCSADGLLVKTTCPNGCANGACSACTTQPFYLDADNDGFGNPSSKVSACLKPAGYVANNLDCDDLDPAAHPGQVAWFNVPTKGTSTFDYDCSKVEEKELPSVVSCVVAGMNCVGDGWVGSVPACGTVATWAKCNKQGGMPPGCGMTTSNKIQSCH